MGVAQVRKKMEKAIRGRRRGGLTKFVQNIAELFSFIFFLLGSE
jgi:hypothetical protein